MNFNIGVWLYEWLRNAGKTRLIARQKQRPTEIGHEMVLDSNPGCPIMATQELLNVNRYIFFNLFLNEFFLMNYDF